MCCWGELKSSRAQSVGEVSAYWSRVQVSRYVETKVSKAFLLHRGLFVLWEGWGERKRECVGNDGKGEERR